MLYMLLGVLRYQPVNYVASTATEASLLWGHQLLLIAFEAHCIGILASSCLPGQKSSAALSGGALAIISLDGHNELIKSPSELCSHSYSIAAGSLGQISFLLQWVVVTADS